MQRITDLQRSLGLSDSKMAAALGVTRQTLHNWRTGNGCPQFTRNAVAWMIELLRVDPDSDSLPEPFRGHRSTPCCECLYRLVCRASEIELSADPDKDEGG